jgi:hypothetical protein
VHVASDVDICNMALGHIGVSEAIEDLTGTTLESQTCALHFAPARDSLLAEYAWPFATRRAVLAEVEGAVRTDWAYVYALPSDCLNARGLVTPGDRNPPVEGRYPFRLEAADDGESLVLLTDLEAAELVYTLQHTTTAAWPPGFVDTLALRLAARLASPLKKDARLALALAQSADMAAQRAAAVSLNQRHPDAPPTPRALTARR